MSKVLKVGDKVMWRGAWGIDPAKPAVVQHIEIVKDTSKYGKPVDQVSWDKVNSRQVVVDLDNGSWAYGNQLKPLQ